MPLDLRGLRPNLDDLLLVDRCEIWSDTQGNRDDVTHPVTGTVTGGGQTLAGTVDCLLKQTFRLTPATESGVGQAVGYYELLISGDSNLSVQPGHRVKITVSPHQPTLVGRWFRVSEVLHATVTLFRRFRLEIRERQGDRP